MRCARDPGLGEMYALVRSEALLAQRLSALSHQARQKKAPAHGIENFQILWIFGIPEFFGCIFRYFSFSLHQNSLRMLWSLLRWCEGSQGLRCLTGVCCLFWRGAQVSDANLAQMPGYRQRVDVLRRLQYVGPDDSVEVKVREARVLFSE